MLADATGITEGLSAAVSRPEVTHDRGAMLRDVAVTIAGGGRDIGDVVVLRGQAGCSVRWRRRRRCGGR